MNQLAIAITHCRRPECLKQLLASLERNVDIDKADIYLYQDGAVNFSSGVRYVENDVIEEAFRIFNQARLPHKFLRRQEANVGAGLQRLCHWTELFEMGYRYAVHLDSDLVVSEYYVQTMLRLFRQYENDGFGMIQTSLRDFRDAPQATIGEAKKIADEVQLGYSRRWEQGLWRHSWEAIEPYMREIREVLERCDYKLLSSHAPDAAEHRAHLVETYGAHYVDALTETCLIREGFQGLCTRVSRHRSVESEGFYVFEGTSWKDRGLDKVTLFDIAPPKKFKIVNNKLCIVIRTLKRRDYFRQALQGFAANRYVRDTDFCIYIDGAVNPHSGVRYAEDHEPIGCLNDTVETRLLNAIIVMKKENTQTAIQKHEMLSTLFPRYDYVMLVDNDIVPDKFYVDTILKMFEQFEDDPKAGIISTSPVPVGRKALPQSRDRAITWKNEVEYGFGPRWEQGFWRETWEKIKPYIEQNYMPHAGNCDYKQLVDKHESCRKECAAILDFFPYVNGDVAIEFAAQREGYLGLHTAIWHYTPIGVYGMYSYRTPEFWADRGFDGIKAHDLRSNEEFSFPVRLRYAEDHRTLLRGEEVYMVGSGTSLDTFPDDFLDDKIGITLHLAYLKYPNAAYRGLCESPTLEWLIKNRPEFIEKQNILTNPLHPAIRVQYYLNRSLGQEQGRPVPILIRYIGNESYLCGTSYEELIEKAINGQPVIAGAFSTVLHSILFAVLTMGAKGIHLIGCDHAKTRGQTYFKEAEVVESRHLRLKTRPTTWYKEYMTDRQNYGTSIFIKECAKHGVRIERYKDYLDWMNRNAL